MTIVAPEHPVLRRPNRISERDWEGWVQERGLYFARTWDPAYSPILETHDEGESPLQGGLLVAPVGRGTYVYTGLSFFRQLPAGVPGALRLFANLLALGQPRRLADAEPRRTFPRLVPGSSLCASLVLRDDGRTPVVLYSPHGRDQLTLLEHAFEAERPDIDVRWLDMGSQEILDRVRFERVNPQADVWFGGPDDHVRPRHRGLAAPALPADVGRPGRSQRRRTRRSVLSRLSHSRGDRLQQQEWCAPRRRPTTGTTCSQPRWRDKVVIRDPMASGTMRAIWGLILVRSIRETGDTAQGMDWLRRLDANTKTYTLNPAILDAKLARAEGLVTLWDLPDILIGRSKGLPFGYTFPRSGTVVIDDAIGLVRGSRHPEAAKAFIDFVGGVEAQLLAAKRVYRLPARHDLPAGPGARPGWPRWRRRWWSRRWTGACSRSGAPSGWATGIGTCGAAAGRRRDDAVPHGRRA